MKLYNQRGTVAGLERLCSILTGKRAAVVEGFRLRRRSPTTLGAQRKGIPAMHGVLGNGMQLGGPEFGIPAQEDWERNLIAVHTVQLEERRQQRESGTDLCPAANPPHPLNPDPEISFYRHFAHRFSVIIFGAEDEKLAPVIDEAVEAAKPAHTLHRICWLDAGLHLGMNSYVGLGTGLAESAGFRPVIMGETALGRDSVISCADAGDARMFRAGSDRVGGAGCRPSVC